MRKRSRVQKQVKDRALPRARQARPAPPASRPPTFYEMRGILKDAFKAEGGGEAFLRRERASFYKKPLGMPMLLKCPLRLSPQPEGGFTVTSPVLPELITEGDTVEEALGNVQDALRAVVELYEDLGRTLPENVSLDPKSQEISFESLVSCP